MNFRQYVAILRDRWLVLALGLVLGLGAGSAVAFGTTPMYAASGTYFISTAAVPGQDVMQAYQGTLLSAQKIKSYTALATGAQIQDEVSERLGGSGLRPGSLTASAQDDTVLLTIRATDVSPRRAFLAATYTGAAFAELVAKIETPNGNGSAPVIAQQVQRPRVPTSPISPRPVLDLVLGAVLGLLAGICLAVARHTFDRTVKSQEALSLLVSAPVLGTTAYDKAVKARPLIVHDQPSAPLAESFRQLRTNLQYVDLDNVQKLIVVTSPLPDEGKTTTACNLAIAFADVGRAVLLIEADLRRPRAAHYLGLENRVGLTSALTGAVTLDQAIQSWGDGLMDFIGAGPLPPNPSELLASNRMGELLQELHNRYDIVLIDTPPTLPVTDAAVLAAQCHGALLVVRHGKATTEQITAAAESMSRVSAKLLGVVVTMTPRSKRHSGYAYAYQYGYGVEPEGAAEPVTRPITRGGKHREAPMNTNPQLLRTMPVGGMAGPDDSRDPAPPVVRPGSTPVSPPVPPPVLQPVIVVPWNDSARRGTALADSGAAHTNGSGPDGAAQNRAKED